MRDNRTQAARIAAAEEHVQVYERWEASAVTAEKAAFYHHMATIWQDNAERLRHSVATQDLREEDIAPAMKMP